MLSQAVQDALSKQINMEMCASYNYLAMSGYCESQNFRGCARWLRLQSQEENGHAMKLYDFVLSRGCKVTLTEIAGPTNEFPSVAAVFDEVLRQEIEVTESINALFELALKERAFAEMVELQWFVTEQVEEESNARDVVAKFQMVGDDSASLLDLDRELGSRSADEGEAEGA